VLQVAGCEHITWTNHHINAEKETPAVQRKTREVLTR